MEITIIPPTTDLVVDRVHVVTMVIKSFKGRKNVDVHLFRSGYDPEEAECYDWNVLLGDPVQPGLEIDPLQSRKVFLEAFTADERDALVEFLKVRYATRLASITTAPLDFPIPLGLQPLSEIPEGKTMGFIRLENLANYSLPFEVHGFYDLAQHDPLVQEE